MTAVGRAWPVTAEALMRSRFEAFRDADADWLLASWHPSTRPESLDLTDNPRWRGLQIVDVVDGGPDDVAGVVEFRATYLVAPGDVRFLHERSNFVREDGRWYYVDGVTTPVPRFHLDAQGTRRAGPGTRARATPQPPPDLVPGPVVRGHPTQWKRYDVVTPTQLRFHFDGCVPSHAAAGVAVQANEHSVVVAITSGIRPESAGVRMPAIVCSLRVLVTLSRPLGDRRVLDGYPG